MLVAFSTFNGDVDRLQAQLAWCLKLGPQKDHDALIVADASTDFHKAMMARKMAQGVFRKVDIITNEKSVSGWIEGPKSLFLTAAREALKRGEPFLLMETDAIPLKPGWVDAIAREYIVSDMRYMGHVYDCHNVALPPRLMSGIGVYWHGTIGLEEMILAGANWDVAMTPGVIPYAHHTKLIHHLWGEPERPPTFADKSVPGTEVFSLDQIPPEAVIWHRNKDGTLIHHLHKRMFPGVTLRENMNVVLPVCSHDIALAIHHAKWLGMLCQKPWPHKAIVAFDKSVNMLLLNAFAQLIRKCFVEVELFCHPVPPVRAWPHAPNWVFQNVAHKMAEGSRPWLWLEPDAVVLQPDWLERLQFEYEGCARNFMGPIVQGMGHVNGGSIYPCDTPVRAPQAMRAFERAWDYDMKPDMIHDCHNASHLMQHIWTVVGEDAVEVGGGSEPAGVTVERAKRWIKPGAVMVHRIKDQSLIDLLMRGQVKF